MKWGEICKTLTRLKEDGPAYASVGICSNFFEISGDTAWPEIEFIFVSLGYSAAYPVQHPFLTPDEAYGYEADLWDRSTEYGRNRWALLDEMLAYALTKNQDEVVL